jgi:hypothetical protein
MYNELKIIRTRINMEKVVAYSRHSPGKTEENHENQRVTL